MAFLTKSDLLFYIDEIELNQIIGNDDAQLVRPMADAEGRIRGKLNHRYNTTAIFADPDNPLYSNVKKCAVDLALFNLYDRVQVRHIPENRKEAMERAERDLYELGNGEWDNDLPLVVNTDDTDGDGIADANTGESYAQFDEFLDTRF